MLRNMGARYDSPTTLDVHVPGDEHIGCVLKYVLRPTHFQEGW